MDWDSVSATTDFTRPPTAPVLPGPLVLPQAPETLKESVYVMLVWPCTEITALNAHLEPFSTTPPKSVSSSVDKTLLMMPLPKNAAVSQDMPFTTKSVPNAQPITSSKTTTVLPAQLTQSTIQPAKSAIVLKVSFWAEMEFALKSVPTTKFTT